MLASFDDTDGEFPEDSLIMDSTGDLYGTTYFGGTSGDGTVFELQKGSSTITVLYSFTGGSNGANPVGRLVMDTSGNLYGTTWARRSSRRDNLRVVKREQHDHRAGVVQRQQRGSGPLCRLILDSAGNLYGTTEVGGAFANGTIFELAKGSHTITALASFNGTDGVFPEDSLIINGAGNLYGTTYGGGASSDGTVFELPNGSSTITTLASFNGADGANPWGGLLMDGAGNLYGTAAHGGEARDGVVYELPEESSTITVLNSFNGTNGAVPYLETLVMDRAGNLYGTTQQGFCFSGSVFEVAIRELETVVESATPTLTSIAGGTVVLGNGNALTDSATLAHGNNPDRHHHVYSVRVRWRNR